MNIEQLRAFCLSLPSATEDVKWEQDLCFCIGEKMFCVTGLNGPFGVTLKVRDDEFEELSTSRDISVAAYVGRYKWVHISAADRFTQDEWEHYIRQAYELVKAKLPKGIRAKLG
ncbi:MmcQ/YjbR family DNA-binding protein [Mucilaginibacter mali]|uniref:MmcQ/YjbR family DNA-binding protein n=1 Tax=Mucilaginibacter mali TaxID=2740462 RepID=A0A7D4TYT4_9SPHI|nr:MmcQ/YjbR family DNA-binding protein [Mucilaginibacter mali]QKJ31617.1 MmcQ/YjbR family DNA-binding protein [Mucilaginibacter mali]